MTSKKILAILIIVAMTALIFTSCDEINEDTQTTTAESSLQKEDGEVALLPDLPEYDWERATLRVLTENAGSAGSIDGVAVKSDEAWIPRDIAAEEETGDPINDAVYRRNRALEEKYNFTVEQVFSTSDNIVTSVKRAVAAGDDYFDIVSVAIGSAGYLLAPAGCFVDLFNVNYLDFEKPWWDKNAIADISIGKKLFFASGDFTLVTKDATSAMLFNKKLLEDFGLESPYELVRNNQWTIGKLTEMARNATGDLDGDGTMYWETDRFGFTYSTMMPMIHAFGERYVSKNENDLPVLTMGSERYYLASDAWHEFISSGVMGGPPYEMPGAAGLTDGERIFIDNRALFMSSNIMSVEKLRGMDTDFGILPMPKLNEHQEKWGNSVVIFYAQVLAIPNFHDIDALDRIGFMLEAVSAESRYTVMPAYYDIQLKGKFARDEESSEMLDIIFNSMVYDIGLIYGWIGNVNTSSASGLESSRDMIEAAMQKTVDAFAALD